MLSTRNLQSMPDIAVLMSTCKAISVLDAILSPEWEFRYYSYNSKWDTDEECMQMRNGHGDEMHVLFHREGAVINGFAHEYPQPPKNDVTMDLPEIFNEFIFGEPVNSIGTTFCVWKLQKSKWKSGTNLEEDNSAKMLKIFDGNPESYIEWAEEYFERSLPIDSVSQIYKSKPLSNDMVLMIDSQFKDWGQLIADLDEINYPHTIT